MNEALTLHERNTNKSAIRRFAFSTGVPVWAVNISDVPELDFSKVHDIELDSECDWLEASYATYEGRGMTDLELLALNLNTIFLCDVYERMIAPN